MPTKTIACPECGAAVAPGRYACTECGALVAALGSPQMWARPSIASRADTGANGRPSAAPNDDDATDTTPSATPVAATPSVPTEPESVAVAPKRARRPRAGARVAPPPDPVVAPPVEWPRTSPEEREIVRRAPARVAAEVPTWPAAPAAAPPAANPPPVANAPVAPPVAHAPAVANLAPAWPGASVPVARPDLPLAVRPASAGWPPANDVGPAPVPAVRTPAGAYLAPSAVLPPLDAPHASRNGLSAQASGEDPSAPRTGGPRVSLTETLDAFGITADMPRRLVGGGAGMVVLGFLLPWISPLGGGGALIEDYLDYWGLAGPGHWIVVAALLGLIAIAFVDRPFGRIRIGSIAIVAAGLLLGLLWQYLFGVSSKSVGVWIVLVGAILVATGGTLDLRRRHVPVIPTV